MLPTTSTERDACPIELPTTPVSHFKLALIAAALRLRRSLAEEPAVAEFPFLQSYADEAATLCDVDPQGDDLSGRLREHIARREAEATCRLPLCALAAEANLSSDAIDLLLTIGLIEEDPRFGQLFEWAQPACVAQQRPTRGLLTAWWREEDDCAGVRSNLHRLSDLGLITVVNPESPRLQWAYEATPLIWDVLRGETKFAGVAWLEFRTPDELPTLDDLILPAELQEKALAIPRLLASGQADCVIVRGPLHNGRKTLLRAIAHAAGYGVLEVQSDLKLDDSRAARLGTLCVVLRALPLFTFELVPGEIAHVPKLGSYEGPQAIALSRHGSIEGKVTEHSLVFELPLPEANGRRRFWSRALRMTEEELPDWTTRFRLTSGGIFRSAELARRQAFLEGGREIDESHVRSGNRALQKPLENQATRVEDCAGWNNIVAAPDVLSELHTLADRCRYRERLSAAVGPAGVAGMNHGVRALFGGPSGTGKTLAARVLASDLQLDLYRLDLSAVVNKYIGETEKNLNQILSRAEELDVILLLDEGDSLLTNRTAVQSSNDRYANLETNFLLQRIESFEGILLITTNALQRIDGAFQRRMDVLIEFRPPEPEERREIWCLHLPPGHEVSERWLDEAARRCALSGGQIRNAALHASLLALARHSLVTTQDAETAVFREYQKMGAVCPLRRAGGR